MHKSVSLFYFGVAAVANAMQLPGLWDIWDIGAGSMGLCGLAVLIWGRA